jgi:hypothetical protein
MEYGEGREYTDCERARDGCFDPKKTGAKWRIQGYNRRKPELSGACVLARFGVCEHKEGQAVQRNGISLLAMAAAMLAFPAQGQTAKPSPYEGVSQPSVNETIDANDANNGDAASARGQAQSQARNHAQAQKPAAAHAAAAQQASATPTFAVRPVQSPTDADSQVVTQVLSKPNELPEGTVLRVLLDQELSTLGTQPGSMFSGRMLENVTKNGHVVIPMGATVLGRVVSVTPGKRFHGPAAIRLRPDEVDLPDGTRYFMHAEVYDMSARKNAKTDDEGNIVTKDHTERTMAEGAASAGGGAATGALVGGVPGAIVGAAIGVSLTTAHWLFENRQAILPKNSELDLGLTAPMSLVPMHD